MAAVLPANLNFGVLLRHNKLLLATNNIAKVREYESLLQAAGFELFAIHPTPGPIDVVEAGLA